MNPRMDLDRGLGRGIVDLEVEGDDSGVGTEWMKYNFRTYAQHRPFLMPPSLDEWVGE